MQARDILSNTWAEPLEIIRRCAILGETGMGKALCTKEVASY